MQYPFQRLMRNATRLTGYGRLRAATAAIQTVLRSVAASQAAAPSRTRDGVIDLEARQRGQRCDEAPASNPPAGEFVSGRWGTASQGRNYKLYVPPQAGQGRLPLVVMLHGCKQDPDDFAAGTRMNTLAREQGFFVLYPAQSRQANPQGCWNWFKHSHQQRGRGEPAALAGMTQDIVNSRGVDPARVYVAGLSAGGAMAAIMAEAYPELYAAAGVHSGLAAGSANDLTSALGAMRSGSAGTAATAASRPTIVFHGDADHTVHPTNAGHVVSASVHGAATAESEQQRGADGRRGYTRNVHRAPDGRVLAEHWVVHGSPHAWSGGSTDGSYTDPSGPDASREMLRFFLEQRLA
jgi:poly(hydroxyalkanoate) depolymerase family esterase